MYLILCRDYSSLIVWKYRILIVIYILKKNYYLSEGSHHHHHHHNNNNNIHPLQISHIS